MRLVLLAVLMAALTLAPTGAGAQERAVGYEGVVPGSGNPPPAPARIPRRARGRNAILTWPGFQLREGGSRFFVQTSSPVVPQMSATSERVELRFPNTTIHLRNSARWLETRHFNTPVIRARLERRGRDMVLVLQLRGAASPTVTSEPGQGGFFYVFVDFPPGQWLPDDPGPERAPAAGEPGVPPGSASVRPASPRSQEQFPDSMENERPPPVQTE